MRQLLFGSMAVLALGGCVRRTSSVETATKPGSRPDTVEDLRIEQIDVMADWKREKARVRLGYLDSLRAARTKWARSGIREYDIQAYGRCFCFGGLGDTAQMIVTVRNRRVVASRPGTAVTGGLDVPVVVEAMFDWIEQGLRTSGIVVDTLRFHPEYGVPLKFNTDSDAGMTDSFFWMTVALFEPRRGSLSPRRP